MPGHEKRVDVCEHDENEHNHQSMLVNGASGRKGSSLIFIRKHRFDDPQVPSHTRYGEVFTKPQAYGN